MSTTDPVTPAPATRGAKTKVVAIVVVLIAFIGGAAIGIIGDRLWLLHRPPGARRLAAHVITERILHKLDDELALTPQQHQQVKQILDAHAARMQQITESVRPQIRQEVDQNNAEIARVLTPEQRAKFDQLKMQFLPRHMRHR